MTTSPKATAISPPTGDPEGKPSMTQRTPLNWSVGFTDGPTGRPAEFIPATVPGAVQLDWARSKNWPPLEFAPVNFTAADNVVSLPDYRWMEDCFWLYRARLDWSPPAAGQKLFLVVAGVDYRWRAAVNGEIIHEQEGMTAGFELEVTGRFQPGDWLEIMVWPAPEWRRAPAAVRQPVSFCKPLVSFGWDFHPRLVPLGIWRDVYLELRPACHLQSAEVAYELNEALDAATVNLTAEISGADRGVRLRWELLDPQLKTVFRSESALDGKPVALQEKIVRPRLWWPNGQGEPALYTSQVALIDRAGRVIHQRTAKVGFRRVRLVSHERNWNDPDISEFPLTRNKSPITFEINNRRIFAKGSNWVSPDIFPGRITGETYRQLLDLAKNAHFNLLRCWGGAAAPHDAFFEMCDERGLMVWQEFPLACARYEATPGYLQVLDQESRRLIRRLRPHASLVLWCGGNELFNAWSRMTDQDLALRLLDRNCYDLDPARPFLMTSPLFGWAHGGYQFKFANGQEVFECFARSRQCGYAEFGVPAPASVETLRKIIPAAELFPPQAGTQWEARHAFHAWGGSNDSWLELWCLESYFGAAKNLEELVAHGQLLQGEGLKFIFEEARRQQPVCSIALNWCFNEPWPTAANNSIVSWPATPKPALAAVAAALRPTLASLRLPKFSWRRDEVLTGDLCLLNDSPFPATASRMEVSIVQEEQEQHVFDWEPLSVGENTNLDGPGLRCPLAGLRPGLFQIRLRVVGRPEWDSAYTLLLKE